MRERAVPILPSRDLHATLAFYERLGFVSVGAPIETYRYLIVERGGLELHFWESRDVDPLTTDFSCYLHVEDARALHEAWSSSVDPDAATGSRVVPPTETDYGLLEFAVIDPDGNLLRVGSPLRP
jgi:catechol 2,3-dioxygenase-like lactoylglutathione lyase family enzyme